MHWQYKCLIDSCKAFIPMQNRLRALKHRLRGYEPDSPSRVAFTVTEGLKQIEWIRASMPMEAAAIMEIGSGWQPIIPILFSLAGARAVFLADQYRLASAITLQTALVCIRRHREQILDALQMSASAFDAATSVDSDFDKALRGLRLTYLAPCDCRRLSIPAASLDVITSRAVLEHIPPAVLSDIFKESSRVLRSGGIVCHFVDNSDHWEFEDKSITRVNFLQFSDAAFRFTCLHPQNYHNRLRHPQYLELLRTAGFTLVREEREVDQRSVLALDKLDVDKCFKNFNKTDLATISSYLLAKNTLATAEMQAI